MDPIELLMVEPSTNPPPNCELFEADLLGGAVGTSKLHLSFGIPIRVGKAEGLGDERLEGLEMGQNGYIWRTYPYIYIYIYIYIYTFHVDGVL